MINLSFLQDFPKDFKFGVATSSYQIEGTMFGNCGKSIWDDFAKRKLNGIDGKLACKHIEYFKEDIKLIKTRVLRHIVSHLLGLDYFQTTIKM